MSEWISVKDRFPEMPGRYLIVMYKNICIAEFRKMEDASFFCVVNDIFTYKLNYATHWAPLPEVPSEISYE